MNQNNTDCLLIIDVQNDFCAGGALEVPDGDAVFPVINAISEKFQRRMLTQDFYKFRNLWHSASGGAPCNVNTSDTASGDSIELPVQAI